MNPLRALRLLLEHELDLDLLPPPRKDRTVPQKQLDAIVTAPDGRLFRVDVASLDPIVDAQAGAWAVGVSDSTVRSWVHRGKVKPAHTLNGRHLFALSDLQTVADRS